MEEKIISLKAARQIIDAGKIKPNEKIVKKFAVTNTSNLPIEIDVKNIKIPCECTTASVDNPFLKPGESSFVTMTVDSKGLSGQVVKSVSIKVKNQEGELRLIITSEIIP